MTDPVLSTGLVIIGRQASSDARDATPRCGSSTAACPKPSPPTACATPCLRSKWGGMPSATCCPPCIWSKSCSEHLWWSIGATHSTSPASPPQRRRRGASGPSPTVDFSDGGFCEPTEPRHHPFGPERCVPLPRGLLVDLTARCRIACGKIILQQPMDEHIAAANLTEENALGGIVQEIYLAPRH